MKKQNKIKLFLYTSSILLLTSSITLKKNQPKTEDIKEKTKNYITSFTEDDFSIAAHRGFSSIAVENSKEAIEEAANKDYVDYIEIDARMTLDEKIILSHNNKLNINAINSISIKDSNYNEIIDYTFDYYSPTIDNNIIAKIDLSEKKLIFERKKENNKKNFQVISLSEGLKASQNKKILLDLKFSKNVEAFTEEIKKELKGVDTSNIIFQSANLLDLIYFQKNTNYNCLAILKKEEDLQYISIFDNVGIKKNLISHDTIKKILQEDKTVAIWTINNTNELDCLVTELDELYKDVIYITNYPDVIATRLNEIKTKEKVISLK